MSRIAGRFEALKAQGKTALVTYTVAGDPTLDTTVPLLHALVEAGADIVELGFPFSDPMAEGAVIQLGHERALANGASLKQVLAMIAEFRTTDADTPVVLMGYANPIEAMGYDTFAGAASAAGVDAVIAVDIPPEEVECIGGALRANDMDAIFLVAPTTPQARIERIVSQASGFIYCVAVKGVTGAGNLDTQAVAEQVGAIRAHTKLPIAVGFGIKDADSAQKVALAADGVVVGSALVSVAAEAAAQGGDSKAVVAAAAGLLREIRAGIDAAAS
ncbi:MAG: tryptophan synthase subunit alpha [Halioglobus sp.]